MTNYPDKYECPISHDLMYSPVLVVHGNHTHHFEEAHLNKWLYSIRGDSNPMTNTKGFRLSTRTLDAALQQEIQAYAAKYNITVFKPPMMDRQDQNIYSLLEFARTMHPTDPDGGSDLGVIIREIDNTLE